MNAVDVAMTIKTHTPVFGKDSGRTPCNWEEAEWCCTGCTRTFGTGGAGQDRAEIHQAIRALETVLTGLAEDDTLLNCACGHGLDEHNGRGCYARLSYEPLATCECKETDNRSHDEVLTANLLRMTVQS